ncbi:dihydropyrimidine dehydrogenase [Haloplanus litoreus]|uniref:dihydropyrimidine dehydrogenase n=1 Tax=Haloplanus litoreus TaxID=767515 RepID=UPI00363E4AB8
MLALASLSGAADAAWARAGAEFADLALLGGLAVDDASRAAAHDLVARGREEFLPDDPLDFVDAELAALADAPIRAGLNVRSATVDPIREVAAVCARHDAVVEVNAHCRQAELCAVGCGETLLRDTPRLRRYVAAASETGATVSVKVRAEVDGVDLPATARRVANAGADVIHVDAMDSEAVVADVAAAAPDSFVLANNGVRDRKTTWEYLAYGADGVSVGRPSDDPAVLRRVARAVDDWARRRADDGRTLEREREGEREEEREVPG